jgi:hypothetical protein
LLAGFFVSQLPWYFDLDTQLDAGARGSILSVRHYFAQWLVRRRCADDRALASPLVGAQVLLRAILPCAMLLPKETGSGKRVGQGWFEDLLKELIERFGGATSFGRAPRFRPVAKQRRNGTGQYCG